jgi:uncharacterized protein YprB with RNaseH-like and TPR domain
MDMREDRDSYRGDLKQLLRESLMATEPGHFSAHKQDPTFHVLARYPMRTPEGLALYPDSLPEVLLNWANIDTHTPWHPEDFLVLDLETTGLGRGNILAFMIGLGYWENGEFVVEQIFLPDPDAEVNSFDRLMELLETRSVLITFNGKTFDIPVLKSRLLYNHIWLDFQSKQHLDLLHIARRLWKNKIPSCALETIEFYVMGHVRDQELDIDGGDIPQTYFQYLISGETDLIHRVFVHNQFDVLYTAALFAIIANAVSLPVNAGEDPRIDYHAVARLYLSQNDVETARNLLVDLMARGFTSAEVAYELGMVLKRDKDLEGARDCFAIASGLEHLPAMLEMSMILEKDKDYPAALRITERLIQRQLALPLVNANKVASLELRVTRLKTKLWKADKTKP